MNKLSLSKKIKAVLNEEINPLKFNDLNSDVGHYKENNMPLNILFILGFILGDGSFSIRVRDSGKGIWFIPMFRMFQKNTKYNEYLFNNIVKFLQNLSIKSTISYQKKNKLLYLNIEGIVNVKVFYSLLCQYTKWFFWKKSQFNPLNKYLLLANVGSRHWKEGQLALLRVIYFSNAFPKMKNNFDFFKAKIEIYFENKLSTAIKNTKNSSYEELVAKKFILYLC